MTRAELIAENPDTPDINLLVIEVPFDYFWRHVIQSPTECLSLTMLSKGRYYKGE
jgi:hypothetical protein